MDYEKEYKDAMERAKKWGLTHKLCIEDIFPELAESDDERIRRGMIDEIKAILRGEDLGFPPQDVLESRLAYLEKQKEPVVDKEGMYYYLGGKFIYCGYPATEENPYDFAMSQQEKQKEQKPVDEQFPPLEGLDAIKAKYYDDGFKNGFDEGVESVKPTEWSEDWREEDIQTRFAFYTYKDDSSELYLSNVFVEEASRNHGFGTKILRAAEKVAETIGATTICLKVKQNSPANAWYRKNGYGYVAFEDGYDWLEKNLEYMKPNKQEWSEEDEKNLKSVVSILWFALNTPHFPLNYERIIELEGWLKSLRPSWKPSEQEKGALRTAICVLTEERNFPKTAEQLQAILDAFDGKEVRKEWKPSEEQMEALERCIDYMDESDNDDSGIMLTLYEQLEKLM